MDSKKILNQPVYTKVKYILHIQVCTSKTSVRKKDDVRGKEISELEQKKVMDMELELLIPFPRDKIADFVVLCAVLCCSVVSNSATPWPTRFLCPWEFSRPEYWSGYPCPPPGGLPTPGIKPSFPPLQEDSLPIEPSGKTL